MEPKVSSPKPGSSPPDDMIDPEEKEVSEDDDDDRNHKHRRRDARSQSSERDALEPLFSRPYRKRNKPYENGNLYGEGDSQSAGSWRNHHIGSQERDISGSHSKRRPSISSFARAPYESALNFRANQSLGEFGPGRGRGRELGFWNQRDSRFSSAEVASMSSRMFAGRGVPANGQSTSWSAFGMVPTMPNGSIDALHPLALQGTLRQSINPGMNTGIQRQRCRDFEERGFCLRGDMCPMEHGVNRIVIEDVQSLSQFNLPVSLPNAHLLGAPTGQGPLPAVCVPTAPDTSSKGLGTRTGADLYDPDQPLWANDDPESSASLFSLNPSTMDEFESTLDKEASDRRCHIGSSAVGFDNDCPAQGSGAVVRPQGPSAWRRIGSSKNKSEVKESGSELRENMESLSIVHGAARHGKHINIDDARQKLIESSLRHKVDSGRGVQKPSKKALRTLFVNGIPNIDNKREALLSHFQKFGEVIDIYIPLKSERAFVQFSKREEAEAALKAPDAVMGNRFIKLLWANRDSIPGDGKSGNSTVLMTASGVALASVVSPSVSGKAKESPYSAPSKSNISQSSSIPTSGHPKPVAAIGPKAPPLQKKLESLELLKEEIRKKQEMLDQKRNEFRRRLDKLEKQATGPKDEPTVDPSCMRHKAGTSGNSPKESSGSVAVPPQAEEIADNKCLESIVSQDPKISKTGAMIESMPLKPAIRPLAPLGSPFSINRFKLDNRPTSFKIIPPLPSGLANVAVLKEHFSSYGDLSTVELERLEPEDCTNVSETSLAARICFTARRAAERAFLDGKCWQGHNLQFVWLTSASSGKDIRRRDNSSASIPTSNDDGQPTVEAASIDPIKEVNLGNDASGGLEKGDAASIDPRKEVNLGNDASGGLEKGDAASIDPRKEVNLGNDASGGLEKGDAASIDPKKEVNLGNDASGGLEKGDAASIDPKKEVNLENDASGGLEKGDAKSDNKDPKYLESSLSSKSSAGLSP